MFDHHPQAYANRARFLGRDCRNDEGVGLWLFVWDTKKKWRKCEHLDKEFGKWKKPKKHSAVGQCGFNQPIPFPLFSLIGWPKIPQRRGKGGHGSWYCTLLFFQSNFYHCFLLLLLKFYVITTPRRLIHIKSIYQYV